MDRPRGLSLTCLTLVLLLAPFTAGIPLTDEPLLAYRVVVVPSDLPLLALTLLVSWRLLRRGRPPVRPGAALFAAIVALLVLGFVLAPSPIGAQTLFRMLGALAIAVVVADLRTPERRFVLVVLALVAVLETALAIAQVIAGGPIGVVGEAPAPLIVHGTSYLPRGTFLHPYPLAGYALVIAALALGRGIDPGPARPWYVAAALAIVPVGITYSRAALAGLLAGILVIGRAALSRPLYRGAVIALVLGAGVPALVWSGGWVARVEAEDTSTSYHLLLQGQAMVLIAEHPLLGVGTGRYLDAARRRFPDPPRPHQPVHSVPLILAAEAGVPAGVLSLALLAALGWRALRAGPMPGALFLMFVPYVLIDVYPYVGWQGPAILGVWVGSLDAVAWSHIRA